MQTSSIIAKNFVKTYYHSLAYNKEKFFQLYLADSVISLAIGTDEPVMAEGRESIATSFAKLNLVGALTNLENGTVDSTGCGGDAITIMVTGEMDRSESEEPMRFSQVFVLLKDVTCLNGECFYLKNDIIHLFAADLTRSQQQQQHVCGKCEAETVCECSTKAEQQQPHVTVQVNEPTMTHSETMEAKPVSEPQVLDTHHTAEQQQAELSSEPHVVDAVVEQEYESESVSDTAPATTTTTTPLDEQAYESNDETPSKTQLNQSAADQTIKQNENTAETHSSEPTSSSKWSSLFPKAKSDNNSRHAVIRPNTERGPQRHIRERNPSDKAMGERVSTTTHRNTRENVSHSPLSPTETLDEPFTPVTSRNSRVRAAKTSDNAPTLFIRFNKEKINEGLLRPVLNQYGRLREFNVLSDRGLAYVQYVVPAHTQSVLSIAKKDGIFVSGERISVDLKRENPSAYTTRQPTVPRSEQ